MSDDDGRRSFPLTPTSPPPLRWPFWWLIEIHIERCISPSHPPRNAFYILSQSTPPGETVLESKYAETAMWSCAEHGAEVNQNLILYIPRGRPGSHFFKLFFFLLYTSIFWHREIISHTPPGLGGGGCIPHTPCMSISEARRWEVIRSISSMENIYE